MVVVTLNLFETFWNLQVVVQVFWETRIASPTCICHVRTLTAIFSGQKK
jgi:hypothetical protein